MSEATIMERLKSETAEQHKQAESVELEKQLASGELPRQKYVEYLGERLFLHRVLEEKLLKLRESDPRTATIITDDRFHSKRLEDDLSFFNVDIDSLEPSEPTKQMLAEMETDSVAILGYFYVFEGSTNGARFIAKALRRVHGLEDRGLQYLDPYGEEQRAIWMKFKDEMNAQPFSDEEKSAMIEAAKNAFTGIMRIDSSIAG